MSGEVYLVIRSYPLGTSRGYPGTPGESYDFLFYATGVHLGMSQGMTSGPGIVSLGPFILKIFESQLAQDLSNHEFKE